MKICIVTNLEHWNEADELFLKLLNKHEADGICVVNHRYVNRKTSKFKNYGFENEDVLVLITDNEIIRNNHYDFILQYGGRTQSQAIKGKYTIL